jgi:PAS domain S-box-containing protein
MELQQVLSKRNYVYRPMSQLTRRLNNQQLLDILVLSKDATAVYTGEELLIEIANNEMIRFWGKDRSVIGRSFIEAVPELIGQPFFDLLKEVWRTGITYEAKNTAAQLMHDGKLEWCHYDFIYRPIKDEHGKVICILHTATDVTSWQRSIEQGHLREQGLTEANEELAAINKELEATNDELLETHQLSKLLMEQLEESETRFRFLLNAIPQQVWTATPDGALDYVNQVISDDFGYSTEEVVGHGWQAFIHPDDLQGCLEKWGDALKSGKEYVVEFRLKFRDGSYRWHLARAVPFAEKNKIRQWVGTNTNIEFQKLNEQRKDEFLSIASHELKTPLTSIKAYNQIIQRTNEPGKLRPFIKKSADHIIRLERMISDLLDVTKINSGKMNYVLEPINISTFLKESIESIQQTVDRHQIILDSAPDVIYNGDQLRLEQVIHNFVNNAVKYSPGADKILVNASVDQNNVIVSVQDFGIGIARENLTRLFDRYYRVDNTAMRFEGLGLGLFISAEILRNHGGSFWIESEQGKGSTFYFRLPLESRQKPAVARTSTFYRDHQITINFNQTKKRLEVDWTGFQDIESVKRGCMLMLDYLQQNQCDRIVNDNTHVMGNWSEATDWVGNVWFPMMERAGLKYFGHVFSPSTFSQLAAIKSIDIMAGIITTQYFTEIQLAEDWIDQF